LGGTRTLYTVLVRGLDLGQDYFGGEGPKDGQPEYDYDESVASEVVVHTKLGLTCIPEETIAVPDFTFPCLGYVKHTNTEADVVKDAISVFFVELIDEGLFWGKAKLRRMYRNFVLC